MLKLYSKELVETLKKLKNSDKHVIWLVSLIIVDIIYIIYISYMTFSVRSPLPFACPEEIITALVFLIILICIALLRARYLKKK